MTHFGNSEGKGGGVKIWKPSVVWYGYFLESPIYCKPVFSKYLCYVEVVTNIKPFCCTNLQ